MCICRDSERACALYASARLYPTRALTKYSASIWRPGRLATVRYRRLRDGRGATRVAPKMVCRMSSSAPSPLCVIFRICLFYRGAHASPVPCDVHGGAGTHKRHPCGAGMCCDGDAFADARSWAQLTPLFRCSCACSGPDARSRASCRRLQLRASRDRRLVCQGAPHLT